MTSRRHVFPKPYADFVQRLRVACGFLLVGLFLWLARPDKWSLAWGLPVAMGGLAVRAWAAGHLKKNQNLAQSGPYALMRNPLYVGTLVAGVGLIVAAQRWEVAVVFAVIFIFVYIPAIEQEEQHLSKLFPEFDSYARRVPMILPKFKHRVPIQADGQFEWSQYLTNREYEAGVGMAIGIGYLVWRTISR